LEVNGSSGLAALPDVDLAELSAGPGSSRSGA
jgi:hypothetical protein